ncbi:hypothetical protein B7463_g8545, partial [Scytalidium lignicola]
MAKAKITSNSSRGEGINSREHDPETAEHRGLLSATNADISDDEDEDDVIVHAAADEQELHDEPVTPRTPNRVRFDLPPEEDSIVPNGSSRDINGNANEAPPPYSAPPLSGRRDPRSHPQHVQVPLLTNIEAPSVTLSESPWGGDIEEWAETERQRPKSGLRSAFMNMANSIIGAGIIGQPYAFRQAGLLTGIILLVGLTVTVDWTIRLIVINSKLSGSNSFQGTVEHCFGKTGLIAISIAQWAFAFGGMVAFGVIIGDSIPHVLTALWPGLSDVPVIGLLANRRVVIVVFVLGISYPLSLYRDIAKLAKASTLALLSMLVILVAVVTQGFVVPADLRGGFSVPLLTINNGVFQAIGVISFAFVCHHNSLLIYGSLEKPTIDRFARVTHLSTTISMIACLLMALAGFLTFGSYTQGNILNNFPSDNTMANVARLCFGLNMLTTLPLETFVCREVMLNYYFPGEPFNMNLHLIFSTSLVVSAMTLSLLTCDLGAVFELVGATSACASWKTIPAVACVVFGVVVMGISLVQAAAKIMRNEGGVTQCSS